MNGIYCPPSHFVGRMHVSHAWDNYWGYKCYGYKITYISVGVGIKNSSNDTKNGFLEPIPKKGQNRKFWLVFFFFLISFKHPYVLTWSAFYPSPPTLFLFVCMTDGTCIYTLSLTKLNCDWCRDLKRLLIVKSLKR